MLGVSGSYLCGNAGFFSNPSLTSAMYVKLLQRMISRFHWSGFDLHISALVWSLARQMLLSSSEDMQRTLIRFCAVYRLLSCWGRFRMGLCPSRAMAAPCGKQLKAFLYAEAVDKIMALFSF
jgi:hypothetical protein